MVTIWHIAWGFTVDPVTDLHAQGEEIMEALLDFEEAGDGISDCSVSVNQANKSIMIELDVIARDEPFALGQVLPVIRAAICQAGGSDPDWPEDEQPQTAGPHTVYRPAILLVLPADPPQDWGDWPVL